MHTTHQRKVFHVLGGPGAHWGGGGAVVLTITKALVAAGDQVWVLCLSEVAAQRFAAVGAHVVTSRFWTRAIHPLLDLLAFWELFWLCRREQFDVVNTHTSKGGILGRVAARLAGVPVVIHTAHGYVFNEVTSPIAKVVYTYIERIAAYFCDLVISVNDEERLIAIEQKVVPAAKIITIRNGIDVTQFRDMLPSETVRRSLTGAQSGTVIGTLGRLMPQKGFEILIRAIPAVVAEYPATRFVFVGNGPLAADLHDLVAELAVTDYCHFVGFREDIPAVLACFDICVLPSLWEGLSIALLEAMAAGKPIITTRIKGNREVIEHEHDGLLVSPADPAALAQAMIALLRDPARARAMGEQAQQKARIAFDETVMIAQTLAAYTAVYQRKAARRAKIA